MTAERPEEPRLAFGDFVIDTADERVIGPGGPVRLGHKAYCVLLSLARQDGRLLTKDALFSTVWDGTIVSEASLTSAVKELRRALGDDPKAPRYIESVYGRGYRLVAPVERREGDFAPGARSETGASERPSETDGRPPLILVSRFEDSAVRDRHPHIAAELRDEILAGIARFSEIQLVADDRPEAEAASARPHSGRDYQLTARLSSDGDTIRIIARARCLADGRIVWAETLTLAAGTAAAGVETIVRRIVGAALPALDQDLSLGIPPDAQDHYDRYLLAKRRATQARTFEDARRAADTLEGLIAERPDFGPLYPPLVRLYNTDFGYTGLGSSSAADRRRALELAKSGLSVDRGNVHAYTVLGFCHLWHGQEVNARNCFEQALALNPYNHVRVQEAATGLMYLGDLAGARRLIDLARELNPLPDDAFYEDSGRLSLIEGDWETAAALLSSIAQGTIWADFYLGLAEMGIGREGGGDRIARWRDFVGSRWHDGTAPDDRQLVEWIIRHHPLSGPAGPKFQEAAQSAIAASSPTAP